jgi:hypothetical protein
LDLAGSAVNAASVAQIAAEIAAAHEATLVKGFYGEVRISWVVKDGTVQPSLRLDMTQTKKLCQ